MKHYLLTLFALAAFAGRLVAQSAAGSNADYVQDFPHTVTVRTYLQEKVSIFDLMDGQRDEELRYRPNNGLSLGLGVTVRGIGLNLSIPLPLHNNKEDRYGKTKRIDIQIHSYRNKLAVDGYLQRYRGFHFNNLTDLTQFSGTATYPYFPDLQTITAGASVMYLFNGNHYSLRAPVTQQDWQLRSAGSFMLGAAIFTHFISNKDSSIIPPYMRHPEFLDSARINAINNYGFTVNGGYGYTVVFGKHWFAGASLEAGLGLGYTQVKATGRDATHKLGLQLTTNGRLSFGYNSVRWMAGFYGIVHGDQFRLPYRESKVNDDVGIVRLVVARRIGVRGKLLSGKQ